MLCQLCDEEWKDRRPIAAGDVSRLSGHAGDEYRDDMRCEERPAVLAGDTKEAVESANRKRPADAARRDAGGSRPRLAAPVNANMAAARIWSLGVSIRHGRWW